MSIYQIDTQNAGFDCTIEADSAEAALFDVAEHAGRVRDASPQGGEPCPRCDRPLASFSPNGKGVSACDGCGLYYEAEGLVIDPAQTRGWTATPVEVTS